MRGGQRVKEKAECPTCHQQVAIHTWSGKLFAHDCGTLDERKARRAAKRAAAKAALKGPCPKCNHDLSQHPLKSIVEKHRLSGFTCAHRIYQYGARRMGRCDCTEFQPEQETYDSIDLVIDGKVIDQPISIPVAKLEPGVPSPSCGPCRLGKHGECCGTFIKTTITPQGCACENASHGPFKAN